MTLAIILTAIICGTVTFVVLTMATTGRYRDYAAQDRDRGLAKLYEARAEQVRVEALHRRAALDVIRDEAQRIREAHTQRQREAACAAARKRIMTCGLPNCEKQVEPISAAACQSQVGDNDDYCEVEFCSAECERKHDCAAR